MREITAGDVAALTHAFLLSTPRSS
jgi:hypothetical protein